MCGLVGCVVQDGIVDRRIVVQMAQALGHRGPDGDGAWVAPDGAVGLGHKRLSIIDLSAAAAQPMRSERSGLVIAYNGEIYNHRDLRRELLAVGVTFRTDHSDTETLLEAIGWWGIEGALERVVGMFAFALYDPRSRSVTLGRDRLGIKPLYVAERGGTWMFASEAKALLVHPDVRGELDAEAFAQYLTFRFVPSPRSLFKGVQKVGAGELWRISLDDGRVRRRVYWKPLESPVLDSMGRGEALDTLEDLLTSSVRYRLEADVPAGVFLSGGVDSGLILKMAAEIAQESLHTYTIAYPRFGQYDESEDALALASSVGATHHRVPADEADFEYLMGSVAYHQDEPIAAPVCLPVYLLSRAARLSGVPVVLAGEGADELFIGYERWLKMRDIERWNQRIPDLPGRVLRRLLRNAAGALLPTSARTWDLLDRMAKGHPLFWGGAMDFGRRERDALLGPAAKVQSDRDEFEDVIEPVLGEFLQARPASDITGWMTYLDLRYRLPELMLPRLDKMGMAHSVEGRVPFLDHRIAEFALTLPAELHEAAGKIGKRLVKEVAARRMPREVVYRRKKGFRAPVSEWKATQGGHVYVDGLRRFSKRTGLFDVNAVDRVLSRKGSRLYFNLVNFMLWYVAFIDPTLADCLPEKSLAAIPTLA